MLKWHGTSQPISKTSPQQGPPSQKIAGHHIVRGILLQDICLIPGTINPFGHKGPTIQWLCTTKHNTTFSLNNYNFIQAK
eukprot:337058-Ditylum_brightwellii.AAC.1